MYEVCDVRDLICEHQKEKRIFMSQEEDIRIPF